MNRKSILSLVFVTLIMHTGSHAQKLKWKEGSMDLFKSVSKMNVIYDYSQMSVGKFDQELEYIQKKKGEYNKKEEGKGDKWEKDWIADRTERYAPQFEELFNKYARFSIGDYPAEKFSMIVKTTATEPGYNIHISRKNAEIDGEIWIVETSDPGKPLARISFNRAPGRSFGGYDYDTGFRIQEAYAALGKSLGKFLK